MDETFRLHKSLLHLGIVSSVALLAAVVLCVAVSVQNVPAAQPIGIAGTIVFGSGLVLSLYLLRAYFVERLTIKGTTLSVRSTFQDREFEVCELTRLRWRLQPPRGSIFFYVLGSRTRLDLHGFPIADRLRMIRVLREVVPTEVQEGWPAFCQQVALPLRDGAGQSESLPPPVIFNVTFPRSARLYLLGMPVLIAAATLFWALFNNRSIFILPFVGLVLELFSRLLKLEPERPEPALTSPPSFRTLFAAYTASTIAMLLMLIPPMAGVGKPIAAATACVVLAIVLRSMIEAFQKGRERRRAAQDEATRLWQEGETVGIECERETVYKPPEQK